MSAMKKSMSRAKSAKLGMKIRIKSAAIYARHEIFCVAIKNMNKSKQ